MLFRSEDHDGTRFNSQGRAKNWNYWNSLSKRIMKDLAKAVVKRQRKAERVANGGNQTRTFVERQCDEVNKLANAVVKVDPDTLPDNIDVEAVLDAECCITSSCWRSRGSDLQPRGLRPLLHGQSRQRRCGWLRRFGSDR